MVRTPSTAAVLGVGTAVAGTVAAGFYGFEQLRQRWPRYRRQRELLREVSSDAGACLRCAAVPRFAC